MDVGCLDEIVRDPAGFLKGNGRSDELALVLEVARETALDKVGLSCGAFLDIVGNGLGLDLSGVYVFEGRNRNIEFMPGRGVSYDSAEGLEERLIGVREPVIESGGSMLLSLPISRGDDYLGLGIFRKSRFSDEDVAVIAASMDVANSNINKTLRLKAWRDKAYKDPLTGIHNRRSIADNGWQLSDKCRKMGKPYSVLFMDVDDFSKVNSRYGHSGGDAVLREIAKKMKSHVRPGDFVARYGGEEFVIILPYTGLKDALHAAQNLRKGITAADPMSDGSSFTVSVGAAENLEGESLQDTINAANKNMYRVKRTLKNATWTPDDKDEETGLLGVSPLYSSIRRGISRCNQSIDQGEGGKVALMMFNIRGFTKVVRSRGEDYASGLLNMVVNSLNGDGPMLDYLDYVSDGPRLARFCDTDRLMGLKYSSEPRYRLASEVKDFMQRLLDRVNGSAMKVGDDCISVEVAGSCCIYDPSVLDGRGRSDAYENPELLLGALRQIEGKDDSDFSIGLYRPASMLPSRDFVDPLSDRP